MGPCIPAVIAVLFCLSRKNSVYPKTCTDRNPETVTLHGQVTLGGQGVVTK